MNLKHQIPTKLLSNKRVTTTLILSLVLIFQSFTTFAQAPNLISYQAILRDGNSILVTNTNVGLRISIRQGNITGSVVYQEIHNALTNNNGLVSIKIGEGNSTQGSIESVDWSDGPYYIQSETDLQGGTNYSLSFSQQLLSVPFAFHANKADSLSYDIAENDPIYSNSIAAGITASDTSNWNNRVELDPIFNNSIAGGISAADTNYWNNKLNGFTETDPIFSNSLANNISATDTTYWNNKLDSFTEVDPIFSNSLANSISTTDTTYWNNKLDGFTEADPIFSNSLANNISTTDTSYWNNKLDEFLELDPSFDSSLAKQITAADTAYWNHKLDSIIEADPVFSASVANAITATDTLSWDNKQNALNVDSGLILTNDTLRLENRIKKGNNIGEMLFWDGNEWVAFAPGQHGQPLVFCNGVPTWGTCQPQLPSLISIAESFKTSSSAILNGYAFHDGGSPITTKGVVWGTSLNPTLSNSFSVEAGDTGRISSTVLGISANTTYYFRAYATNVVGTAYGQNISFITDSSGAPQNLAIGDAFGGGTVAYIFQNGDAGYVSGEIHGIVCATSDENTVNTRVGYGCENVLAGASGTTIGTGATNTQAAVNNCGTSLGAFGLCVNKTTNGYNDWFLPSADELYKVYLVQNQIGGFTVRKYWTSTELSGTIGRVLDMSTGIFGGGNPKGNSEMVRAIREF